MRYPYGHPDNWETTDSGKQIIYKADPADILDFDRPRVIYELRKAIEDAAVFVEVEARWCLEHDRYIGTGNECHSRLVGCIPVPLYIEARDP
jgi:hypothetical protein